MPHTIYKNVWQLAGPNILSNILMVAISFAHLWIVAPFGPEMSAAVVTGGRIHFLLMAASMALSVATTAVVARAKGAEDAYEASASATASLSLACILAILTGGFTYICAPQCVALFGLSDKASTLAVEYIRPMALTQIAFALAMTIATSFRAIGNVVRPMIFTGYSTAFSIAGSYILLHGAFGMPALGIRGIAYGTAAGQLIVVIWFMVYWLLKRYSLKPVSEALLDTYRLRQLITIGAPAALEQLLIQAGFIVFMAIIAGYGTAAFAAYGIGITILSVCIVIGLGFGTASATLSGISLGASDPDRAIQNGWAAARMAALIMTFVAISIYLGRGELAALLTIDPETRVLTEYFIIILALIQPLMAVEFAIGGALRGGGDTRFPLYVTLAGVFFGRLIPGAIAALASAPVEIMYAVILADYCIKAVMLVLRFRSSNWLKAANKHLPLAVQSEAGVGRAPVRRYASKNPGSTLD